jgi:surfeit locus 1 family protein
MPTDFNSNREGAAKAAPSSSSGRRGFLLTGFLLVAALIFTGLGTWQVQRLFWKLDLIARVDARVHAAPVAPPAPDQWARVDANDAEYRHVTMAGVFEHDRTVLVQAVTERGPGFWLLTPLRLDDGTAVIVNRGFVPPDRREPSSRSEGDPTGRVTVTGLLRISEPGGGFLRANDPGQDRWYSRDVAAIAQVKGVDRAAPYVIDADATPNPGGFPVGGLTVVSFRNSHLVYALTWFALAIMSCGALFYVRRYRTD